MHASANHKVIRTVRVRTLNMTLPEFAIYPAWTRLAVPPPVVSGNKRPTNSHIVFSSPDDA